MALLFTRTIARGVTLKPNVLETISGAGVILKTYSEAKNSERKVEMCKFAFTTYGKVLTDLLLLLRGVSFNKKQYQYLDYAKVLMRLPLICVGHATNLSVNIVNYVVNNAFSLSPIITVFHSNIVHKNPL